MPIGASFSEVGATFLQAPVSQPTYPWSMSCWFRMPNVLETQMIMGFCLGSHVGGLYTVCFQVDVQGRTGMRYTNASTPVSESIERIFNLTFVIPANTYIWAYLGMASATQLEGDDSVSGGPRSVTIAGMDVVTLDRISVGRRGNASGSPTQFYTTGDIAQFTRYNRLLTTPERTMLKMGAHPEDVVPGRIVGMLDTAGASLAGTPADRYGGHAWTKGGSLAPATSGPPGCVHPQWL